jgi:pyridoxamine 5'-phosphate oxidase
MRERARSRGLSREDLDPDPVTQFRAWLGDAEGTGDPLPNATALATAGPEGRPSLRHVLLRTVDRRGFVFFTNYRSRKGRELTANPHAALSVFWRELDRQVCVTGSASRLAREESEAYFASRPRDARIGAWASRQSEVIPDRATLEARVAEIDARYPGDDVPLPDFWGGFRLDPETIEFWQGREHRLHDRFLYTRRGTVWMLERLAP